jgi:hypothetical protein
MAESYRRGKMEDFNGATEGWSKRFVLEDRRDGILGIQNQKVQTSQDKEDRNQWRSLHIGVFTLCPWLVQQFGFEALHTLSVEHLFGSRFIRLHTL